MLGLPKKNSTAIKRSTNMPETDKSTVRITTTKHSCSIYTISTGTESSRSPPYVGSVRAILIGD